VVSLIALLLILGTSIIKVPTEQVGVVRKIYGYKNLPDGHIIATQGETGYQAEIIPPGTFRVSLFFNIVNDIDYMPVVHIPNGFYGRITARDGQNLRDGQIIADGWPQEKFAEYMTAQYFLTEGHGQKGEQLSVLKPGTYPINLKLFQVRIGFQINGKDQVSHDDIIYDENGVHKENTPLDTAITVVPAGFVGVVRSSVQAPNSDCRVIKATVDTSDSLSAELVPQNCKGVWSYALPPNDYFLNRNAYDVTLVDTRVQTLEFKGGFTRRWIDLKVDAHGDFVQTERAPFPIEQPKEAVDMAVNTKVEGWEIPQELRIVVQISPEHAPIIVAAVGGLREVEHRIMVPSIRSHVRNVYGGMITLKGTDKDGKATQVVRQTKVLDTVEQRTVLEDEILTRVKEDGRRAGVDVKEVRLGESIIPPELLLARQREQLATQLRSAFIQEQTAQKQRQETEAARATADQQATLVTAQIKAQAAEQYEKERQRMGHAERSYLEEVASGQAAQTAVLGKDSVILFNMADKIVDLLKAHPEIIGNQKWPTNVFIGGQPLENAAALLGTLNPALLHPQVSK
jgi:regulator of protease activity HflC (stomatin/prohibitin superfamily)